MPQPDPSGLYLDEREDGSFTITAEVWWHGKPQASARSDARCRTEHRPGWLALLALRNGDRALQAC
jgi:hypothetical protein